MLEARRPLTNWQLPGIAIHGDSSSNGFRFLFAPFLLPEQVSDPGVPPPFCRSLPPVLLHGGDVAEQGQLVARQVELVHPLARPEVGRGEGHDPVVREVQDGEVAELRGALGYLGKLVVAEVEPLQGVHPIVGGSQGKVR